MWQRCPLKGYITGTRGCACACATPTQEASAPSWSARVKLAARDHVRAPANRFDAILEDVKRGSEDGSPVMERLRALV